MLRLLIAKTNFSGFLSMFLELSRLNLSQASSSDFLYEFFKKPVKPFRLLPLGKVPGIGDDLKIAPP